uniref:Uncharacterized protein n=1 Tax=Hyaloperonospora arabidopsidis (strain Emoy2) TaxID=559515 RepID=M4BVX8_HYAAE
MKVVAFRASRASSGFRARRRPVFRSGSEDSGVRDCFTNHTGAKSFSVSRASSVSRPRPRFCVAPTSSA